MKDDIWFISRWKSFISLALCVFVLLPGCASRDSEYRYLYSSLQEEIETAAKGNPLEGRRIVIDPGHGGRFRGIVGADSLSEAEVNLGVALYLWGMLNEENAAVMLTRTTDKDFVADESSGLRSDLRERTAKADSFLPEVFISIHHNSTLPMNRDKNLIEVYYDSEDTGASLELARSARLHLSRNLGIAESVVKPGNYFVLRNRRRGAAILGEASYLSHPVVEDRLKLASKQKLEAEAYFLALVDYFSRGVPSITMISPQPDTLHGPSEIVYGVRRGYDVPLDPSTARVYIDGKAMSPVFDGDENTIRFGLPEEIPNGTHLVRAEIASVRGASASSPLRTLVVDRLPGHIIPLPTSIRPDGTGVISVKVLDVTGYPVIDGTEVTARRLESDENLTGKCEKGICSLRLRKDLLPGKFEFRARNKTDTLFFEPHPAIDRQTIYVLDEGGERPVPYPVATYSDGKLAATGDSAGRIHLPDSIKAGELIVTGGGFRPAGMVISHDSPKESPGKILLKRLYGARLAGRRIVIDPARGGSSPGHIGEDHVRESSLNLEMAVKLHKVLTASGAEVRLTREGEETLSLQERIFRTNRFRPDAAIRIRHDYSPGDKGDRCLVLHYPGSEKGRELASYIGAALEGIYPETGFRAAEAADPFLTQTSCPAVEVRFISPSSEVDPGILSTSAYQAVCSEKIFGSILRYFEGGDSAQVFPLDVTVMRNGRQLAGAYVSIDNILTLPTDDSGSARFSSVESGEHMFLVQKDGEVCYQALRRVDPESQNEIIITLERRR